MSLVFQIFSEDGTLEFDHDETFARLIHSESFAFNWSGTFSVPDFDDTKGIFTRVAKVCKYDKDYPYPRVADTHPEADSLIRISPAAMPNSHWNNTTKIMTITAAADPPSWYEAGDVTFNFIHYK